MEQELLTDLPGLIEAITTCGISIWFGLFLVALAILTKD